MSSRRHSTALTLWLLICCAMIFVMALLGAVTRLSEAGLAITVWDPIMGVLPPITAAEWQAAFAQYRQIPQFQLLHSGMDLPHFQHIYFWEWLHRLWGRLIGLVFAVPLLVFWLRGQVDRVQAITFSGILLLGGLQGLVGWFMVQSGLAIRTSVSPYRLALHLSFALVIYGLLLRLTLKGDRARLSGHGGLALALLAATIFWGGLVAGGQAGLVYNTWPLMAGEWLPEAAGNMQPVWRNAFENAALVQFIHRWLGPLTVAVILTWVGRCWGRSDRKPLLAALAVMAVAQVGLGLATLLSHVQMVLAVLHQAGAITLLTLLLLNLFSPRRSNRWR